MKSAVSLILCGLVLAGCAASGGATKCVTELQNADGSKHKVIAYVDPADPVAGSLCEGDYASAEEVTAAMFGKQPAKAAQAPLSALSTPEKPVAVAPAKPAAVAPARPAAVAPAAALPAKGVIAQCSKTMTGGTGYACTNG